MKFEIGEVVECNQGEASIAVISSEASDINGGGFRYYAHTFNSAGDYLGEFKVYSNELGEMKTRMVDAQIKWMRELMRTNRPHEIKSAFKQHMVLFFPKLFNKEQS